MEMRRPINLAICGFFNSLKNSVLTGFKSAYGKFRKIRTGRSINQINKNSGNNDV